MRELTQIVAAFAELSAEGKSAAIATVVVVEGSSYRRPGARMLIAADGRIWGGVSGGCLERDVARRARNVIDTGDAIVCRYETGDAASNAEMDEENFVSGEPGLSLGCGGKIDILIERVSTENPGPVAAMQIAVNQRQTAPVATVVRTNDSASVAIGQHQNSILDTDLKTKIVEDLRQISRNEIRRYPLPNGSWVQVFLERILPPQALIIFGDGQDVEPVVEMARTLGWHITVVGTRSEANLKARFAPADRVICAPSDDPSRGALPLEESAAVLVMGHHLARDSAVLRALADHPPAYVGILGPRKRTQRMLALAGVSPDRFPELNWLYSPVGLDIGAATPEQIALAKLAEIQAVLNGRSGGFLRDVAGPISAEGPVFIQNGESCPT
jgi:xanthine/CO dehydrogenase XdhC/CoxF family maturation factor